MEKKLLIYETTHYETLPALVELALEKFGEITIFAATPSIQDDCSRFPVFENKRIRWTTKPARQSHRGFIQSLFTELSTGTYTHLFINSLDNNLLYFAIKLSLLRKKIHIVLTVHCIHDYTRFHYNTLVSTTESLGKKILHRKIGNYRVLAPAMPGYLKTWLDKIQVAYIPGLLYRSFRPIDFTQQPFQIVIPGTVERKRRTYEQLPAIIQAVAKHVPVDKKIELILLGKSNTPYGEYVRKKIRAVIANLPVTLVTFDDDVRYETYSQYYSTAHIVWAPVRRDTESIRGIHEINGLSNSAGHIVDFPHYARPSLLPSDIEFSPEIDALIFHYDDGAAAASMLNSFIKDSSVLHEREIKLKEFCAAYTASRYRQDFNRIMNL